MLTTLVETRPAWVHISVEKPKRYLNGIEVLDEEILEQHGRVVRIRRWLRGSYPQLGVLIKGLTGIETVVEKTAVKAMTTFQVFDAGPVSEVSQVQPQ